MSDDMTTIHICGPEYHCRWRDKTGKPWYMEWTAMGPVFSEDADFRDGGVDQGIVPQEILEHTEAWAKAVLKREIVMYERPEEW